ncbi:MAG: phosphatidylserine/phosphatidylglycerophosphate/cardiolipin synthase family protein [Bacteroidales bacterium]|nr:phosphatidylserine/phosphatidylglycerophosphate/cardiolipin synthase family protein [Bacteroidales bacterium]MBN2763757.1 phosphatidylserine/phosphatidylglycerophosphate/cardiolipin synthase family protein [Bacteroidales bacterium]
MDIKFITNEQLYKHVIEPVASATAFVWIGTADIKDMHVHYKGSVQSFLSVLDNLVKKKVAIRMLHAKEPGVNFRKSFDKYPLLWKNMERQLCPRVHFKHIIIDGKFAYSGSANLTGAGLGIKSENTRNFESGFITTNPVMVEAIMNQFDEVWMGKYCKNCKRRDFCGDLIL